MRPEKSLPHSDEFVSADDYVEQLLHYVASTPIFQVLCGGVHIMDFYTSDPGLFYSVVPEDWQAFLLDRAPMELLDFLLRDDVETAVDAATKEGRLPPPASLVQYVRDVRRFSLQRDVLSKAATETAKLPRKITMGMNVKKIHEVTQFSEYVDRLADAVSEDAPTTPITHLVDVGSGQNYLGRALASKSLGTRDAKDGKDSSIKTRRRGVVAVESKGHNIAGAKGLDMMTGVMAAPARPMRNKKLYQQMLSEKNGVKQTEKARNRIARSAGLDNREGAPQDAQATETTDDADAEEAAPTKAPKPPSTIVADMRSRNEIAAEAYAQMQQKQGSQREQASQASTATESDNLIQYVEGRLENGDLSHVLSQVQPLRQEDDDAINSDVPSSFLTVSIHSCGNLSHYGLRALELNPDVRAVAIVGCCYNLLTERLGPPTYKVPGMRPRPTLQPVNGRVMREEERRDPEGFPMSARFATYSPADIENAETGIRFNITARMMACQAPANWTEADSETFFTRHFYRAILQRIFLDRGVLQRVRLEGQAEDEERAAVSPIIIGSLRKACYTSLPAYVRGAVAKIAEQGNGNGTASSAENAAVNAAVAEKMADLTDADLDDYNVRYGNSRRRCELSAVWSLMAFSAGVVESAIVADRWQYLREQQARGLVRDCWVESVFSYDQSPRNLVVVGIRGEGEGQ
ncbi:hypothetical protein SBRCBS47491_009431 [Sporothrix bragantina]|uniref:Methyltransferase domain-containing protein n=1 Tax=Sporothrix bragantina TaxID=671064 RepID=A0ABP0CUM7_9PEZI